MANKFNKYLKLDPTSTKGNLGDYQHADRLFVDDYFRLSPKHKFLYYVVFRINPGAIVLSDFGEKHKNEINMLVKTVDLPKFEIDVDTKQQYNRKKNYHTRINYDPVNITFHDDNDNVTNKLWQAYYKYYFVDSNYTNYDAAGNVEVKTKSFSQNAYKSPQLNKFNYGLDNGSTVPFFDAIQIYQLSRQKFTGYTLVNPIITEWSHDTMDYSDNSGIVENSCTVMYESVFYSTGLVEEGNPRGFAEAQHYDTVPSPIVSGTNEVRTSGMRSVFGTTGENNLSQNVTRTTFNPATETRSLSREGLRNNEFSIGNNITQEQSVSGIANTVFPKSSGLGGSAGSVVSSQVFDNALSNITDNVQQLRQELLNSPQRLRDLALNSVFKQQQISNGNSDINRITQEFNNLPEPVKQDLENQALNNLSNIVRGL